MSAIAAGGAGGEGRPARPSRRADMPPSAMSTGPRNTPNMIGMLVRLLMQLRREAHRRAAARRVEHESAVGGVVVGDEHDVARIQVPGSATTFHVAAVWQRARGETTPAAARRRPDPRGGNRARERGEERGRAAPPAPEAAFRSPIGHQ